MGSVFNSELLPAMPRALLKETFQSLIRRDRVARGNGGYTGSFAEKSGSRVLDNVFATRQQAEEFLEEECDKFDDALFVRVAAKTAPIDNPKIKEINAKIAEISQQQRCIEPDTLKRAKSVKATTRGCTCGSKIALKHLKTIACPVCGNKDFVFTAADRTKIASLAAKEAALRAQIQAIEDAHNAQALAAAKADPDKAFVWLVGAYCRW